MDDKEVKTAEGSIPQAKAAELVAQGIAQESARRSAIAASFSKFLNVDGVAKLQAECEANHQISAEDAGQKLLAHLGKNQEPVSRVTTVEDARDKFNAGVQASLMARAHLAKDDTANNFRGYSLMEIARASLAHVGVRTEGMTKLEVVGSAFTHTGSDFGNLLANVANKAMLMGFDEAEETYQLWTRTGTLPDFKIATRAGLDNFPSLDKIPDGGEYKYASVGDRGEQIQLATYGKLFSINRQTIINDDLGAFTEIPRKMGRAANRTVGNLVYAVLTSNPNMADGKALFHADHGNLLTGAAISTASVDALRGKMATQKDSAGSVLGIRLAYLLVPDALMGLASQVANDQYEVGSTTKNNTVSNWMRNRFEVISDARLDAASTAVWYGAANPTVADTIEVSYLDGISTPTLEQKDGWDVDGTEFKVRMDAGVKALSYFALAKNPGA